MISALTYDRDDADRFAKWMSEDLGYDPVSVYCRVTDGCWEVSGRVRGRYYRTAYLRSGLSVRTGDSEFAPLLSGFCRAEGYTFCPMESLT